MKRFKIANPIGVVILLFLTFAISSCRKDEKQIETTNKVSDITQTDVITSWNSTLEVIEQAYGAYRPCPVTTLGGYLGLANYELCVQGMPDYRSIADNYPGLILPKLDNNQQINWPLAINASSAYMFGKFFPNDLQKINATENQLYAKYSQGISSEVINASVNWGKSVSEAVYNYSKSDLVTFEGHLNLTPAYNVIQGDGYWIPTFPDYSPGKFPQWGKGRTFAISAADKIIPAPIPYSTNPKSKYYAQALETYNFVISGTEEDKWIAEFWSDDIGGLTFSPPVRWFAIATQVYNNSNCNLEKALITNAKIGLALSDAAVACWDNKYKYQVERPITYIRKNIDQNWITFLTKDGATPNFPAYPSGHATFGAAAAEVLTYEFGHDFAMTDRCHEGRTEFRSTPRAFPSFYKMAEETAISRLPLGVHFRMDADSGLDLGYRVGRKVNALPFGK